MKNLIFFAFAVKVILGENPGYFYLGEDWTDICETVIYLD